MVEKQLPALPECLVDARHLLDPYRPNIPSEKIHDYALLVSEALSTVIRRVEPKQAVTVFIELGRHSALVEVCHPVPGCGRSFGSEDDMSFRVLDRLTSAWGVEERPRMIWFSLDW